MSVYICSHKVFRNFCISFSGTFPLPDSLPHQAILLLSFRFHHLLYSSLTLFVFVVEMPFTGTVSVFRLPKCWQWRFHPSCTCGPAEDLLLHSWCVRAVTVHYWEGQVTLQLLKRQKFNHWLFGTTTRLSCSSIVHVPDTLSDVCH